MYFLYPTFLFALSAILIPIIIHLFRFRRFKTVYFTNVQFLKEVKETTTTYSRLKHLLVLLARILTIIFLVLAFAQPYLSPEGGSTPPTQQQQHVSIYIDNSFSMNAAGEQGGLIDDAINRAREIIDAYGPDTRYQILTNAFKGEHQRFMNKEQLLSELKEVAPTSHSRQLSEILQRQEQMLTQSEVRGGVAYVLSDFQRSITNIEQLHSIDTSFNASLVPIRGTAPTNVYIDSCWYEIPVLRVNHVSKLNVRLKNTGTEPVYNLRVALQENDQIKAMTNLDIPAESSQVDTLSFTIKKPGWHTASLSIQDAPVTFDDQYFITFEVTPNVKVLNIREDTVSKYLKAIFRTDDYFMFEEVPVQQLDYSAFSNYQLIILDHLKNISSGLAAELEKFVAKGGDIAVFPHRDIDFDSYRQFLTQVNADPYTELWAQERNTEKINTNSPVFRGVFEEIPENIDLPVAQKSYQIRQRTRTQKEMLLQFRDGQPLMSQYDYKNGALYLSAVSLRKSFSNLPNHAVFVPMIYNIGLLSNNPKPLSFTIGKNTNITLSRTTQQKEQLFRLTRDDFEIIPEQRTIGAKTLLNVHQQIEEAGIYTIHQDGQPDYERYVAFNYDRKESDLTYTELATLQSKMQQYPHINVLKTVDQSMEQTIAQQNRGTPLWKLCVIFALLFLLTEILLLRFWPTAETATQKSG